MIMKIANLRYQISDKRQVSNFKRLNFGVWSLEFANSEGVC
jgi:hypothetical protein